MLSTKGIDFNDDYPRVFQYGAAYHRDLPYSKHVRFDTDCDVEIPEFKDDRKYIERWVYMEDEK